jgi:hypothetical protein
MHYIDRAGYQVRGQLIVHFLLAFSFKSSECDRRIRRTEEPERPATKAVPKPDKTNREIKDIKVP